MSRRRGVRVHVLCEDDEHERFTRNTLLELGFHRTELRFDQSPAARGAAEQWVRDRYANEVRVHRRKRAAQNVALVVVVDADKTTVPDRHRALDATLEQAGLEPRSEADCIAVLVPKRHIETWVAYFSGGDANENDPYKRAMRGADYKFPAERFVHFFRVPEDRPEDLLPSISAALGELNRLPIRSG